MFITKIGIDLGTCNSLVFIPKKGVVLNEPSVVAIAPDENQILAVGKAAKEMIGRTPENIVVYRPMKDGVIADFRVTQAMLKYFITAVKPRFQFLKPELIISVPAGITSTEKRAVIEAATLAGAKNAYIAKEPILAAIGAGIPIHTCSGHMIVNIGGGTTEVAVISLGGIVTFNSIRVAGDKMNTAVSDYIRKRHNLAVGEQTAEEVKIKIGTAVLEKKERIIEIRGRDLMSGMPKSVKITSNEVSQAIEDVLADIVQGVKAVLRDTPPELASDIMDKGMIISGGGALLRNLDQLIAKATGVPCFLADDAFFCVAKGTGAVLENLEAYKKSVMSKK
ncbi:rod shape-determining protein [Patescibacteria group bacterium]|nr:rod shape-determining protein [Patescibacteria group bacterium]MBU4023423.1 rod shape-determining protein [Patescibacteria group bacterium]MBU4077996.1 rod shape-determining protein [Patescibacteria group bacterium]